MLIPALTSPRRGCALAACVLAALVWFAAPAAAQGTWSRLSTTGQPMPGRSTPAAAALGPHVYLFGGVRDDFQAGVNTFHDDLHRFDTAEGFATLGDTWQFNLATHTWTDVTPPQERNIAPPRNYAFAGFDFSCDGSTGGQVWNEAVHTYALRR
jgi:hypothetical protein